MAGSAARAQTASGNAKGAGHVVVLETWSDDPLCADGWSVDEMFDDTEVVDATGEEIGDVENLISADDGTILAIVAQVGGFWDIGDAHVSIPWSEVTLSADGETLMIPVAEETIDDYAGFDGMNAFNRDDEELFAVSDADATQVVSDDLEAGPMVFKATDLMNDLTCLNDDVRYGYVSDIWPRTKRSRSSWSTRRVTALRAISPIRITDVADTARTERATICLAAASRST